jgi:cytochrome c oxidase subunit 4
MSTSVLLSLGSILLGLIAWAVPILSMKHPEKYGIKKCCNFIIVSFGACVASLCLQFFEINHRVEIEDWSAIMDTIGTLKWVAVILAVITLILNAFVLRICYEEEIKA